MAHYPLYPFTPVTTTTVACSTISCKCAEYESRIRELEDKVDELKYCINVLSSD